MAKTWQVRNGRVFFQLEELVPYDLVDCSGLSDWNRPRGGITPIREQSKERFGAEDVAAYQRASPDMATFTYVTRLRDIQNFVLTLNCEANVQVLLGDCGDPNDYYGFENGLAWVRCPPGDLTGEALAVIEGEDVPIGLSNPFSAIYGPYLVDFKINFLSRRTISETGPIYDITMFAEECLSDCLFKAGNGQYGYAVSGAQAGSPVDDANVWFTEDYGDEWALTSTGPFDGGEDISAVVKTGTVNHHRVIVSRGETVAGEPAQIAYADVTTIGQTTWVQVNVGAVNGEYIRAMSWPVFNRLFAVTDEGRVYVSRDGGVTWAISYTEPMNAQLNDVSFIRQGVGWVVGNGDLLLHTTDWGDTWTVVAGPNEGSYNLTTCCVDLERKLIVGDSNGGIHGTVDEGAYWVDTPPQGITATNVVRIRGYMTHWKWAVVDIAAEAPAEGNSRVVRSTDGGASFRLWDLAQNLVPNNGLHALYVVDVNRALVGGNPYPVGTTAFLTRTETSLDKIV